MLGLNLTSDLPKESKPSLRDALSGLGALAARFGGSGRGLFLAASLAAGVIGGLVPTALRTHLHPPADAAALSRAVDELQKLEAEQAADAQTVHTAAQANAALQARLDTLEKRLAKVERANVDTNPTGAVTSPPPLAKADGKRKPPKS